MSNDGIGFGIEQSLITFQEPPASRKVEVESGDNKSLAFGTHSGTAVISSPMVAALMQKTGAIATAATDKIDAYAQGRMTIDSLIQEFGLTSNASAATELTKLEQLGNSLDIRIKEQETFRKGLELVRKTLEVAEEGYKTAGQVSDVLDAENLARHKETMRVITAETRQYKQQNAQANAEIWKDKAQAARAKAAQIMRAKQPGVATATEYAL